MKTILIIPFLLFSILVKSQSSIYHPFPTTTAHWVYQYFNDNHQATGWYGSYSITGDTIISGKTYKKISGCDGVNYACNSGGIRDSNKVIYFRPDTSINEYVLYDFNLQLGDTLFHPFGGAVCSNDTVIVWNIDSVLCSDDYHRKLYLSSYATWMEGIGSDAYLLRPTDILCVSGNDILECMITDSGFSYPSGIGSCIAAVSTNPISEILISISPIPSNERIEIKSSVHYSELRVFNLFGQEQFVSKTSAVAETFDISFLSKGIYFFQFQFENGIVLKKFIRE
jgi:hypothetical protein